MTARRVVFIEPASGMPNVFENYMRLPLMGSLYLGTILHEAGHEVRILNENILGREIDPFEVDADVYCLTALTGSANRAKYLAAQLKQVHPRATVAVGGIHASLLPEEFTDVADHVVVGEAEYLIEDLVEGRCTEKILQGRPVEDLAELPPVRYDLLEGYRTLDVLPIMTSRGCPFNCSFCTVTKVFGRRFRMFSPERIMTEIENALQFFSIRNFFFYDDNFTSDRKRLTELCDQLIEKRMEVRWVAQVRTDLARDPDLVRKMAEAGCRWVFIGFESIEDETLKALRKNQTRADIEKAIAVFHRFGLNIHGMFMFGEDHDTPETFQRTVDFAVGHGIDTVQFLILTPFPGTACYEQLDEANRLLHTDWDYYNGMFAVFQPKKMGALTLQTETYKAYRKFYSLRRTALDTLALGANVLLDALVWNFSRAQRHNIDTVLIRGGAKVLVSKGLRTSDTYLRFLAETERNKLLNGTRREG